MNIRGFFRRGSLAIALLAASFWIAPSAFAHSHVSVGIGIAAPGFGVSVGNCWRCGYWAPPPVYYAPRPAYYYGYGYDAPRYHYYRGGYGHDRGSRLRRGGDYH